MWLPELVSFYVLLVPNMQHVLIKLFYSDCLWLLWCRIFFCHEPTACIINTSHSCSSSVWKARIVPLLPAHFRLVLWIQNMHSDVLGLQITLNQVCKFKLRLKKLFFLLSNRQDLVFVKEEFKWHLKKKNPHPPKHCREFTKNHKLLAGPPVISLHIPDDKIHNKAFTFGWTFLLIIYIWRLFIEKAHL